MDFKGAIFDCDGTLLDSMGIYSDIGSAFFRKRSLETPAGIDERVEHLSLEDAAKLFSAEFFPEIKPEDIIAEWYQHVKKGYEFDCQLKPNVREYLHHLKNKGVMMTIATLTAKDYVEIAVKRLAVADLFHKIFSAQDIGKDKTTPDIYLLAADSMNLKPSECAVFEDSPIAAKTAMDAGFHVFGIHDPAWEYLKDDGVMTNCHCYIKDFGELL